MSYYVAYFLYEISSRIKRERHSVLECMYVFPWIYVKNELPQFYSLLFLDLEKKIISVQKNLSL